MAAAENTTMVVMTEAPAIKLMLTPDEALTLAKILSHVGGDPRKTRRGHASEISAALRSAGVHGGDDLDGGEYLRGNVYFERHAL